jgi:23S rRNA pseudouridine2605 synthase
MTSENHKSDKPASAQSDGEHAKPAIAGERIAKRLARAGVASRRDAEIMIAEGRITLNGKTLNTPAMNVTESDKILIDGKPIPAIERTRLWLFHKPAGMLTTNKDPEGRATVFDSLPAELPRVVSIGRLDYNTEGLLLLTNDGGLARMLELPSTGWLRRYRVRVHGTVDEGKLAGLQEGIAVDGVLYGAIEAAIDRVQGSNTWLTVGIREGKNREVRNVMGALGLEVNRLIRVSYGPFQLGELAEGAVLEVRGRTLRDQLGDRLAEEAGCNFDAPIIKSFSNKPVEASAEASHADKPERPLRRLDKQELRDAALSRLDTGKPSGKGRPKGKGGDRREEQAVTETRASALRNRASHVWMAPGARTGRPAEPGDEAGADKPAKTGRYAGKGPRPVGRADERKPAARPARADGRPGQSRDDTRSSDKRPGSGFAKPASRGEERPRGKWNRPDGAGERSERKPFNRNDDRAQSPRPPRDDTRPQREDRRPPRDDNRPPRGDAPPRRDRDERSGASAGARPPRRDGKPSGNFGGGKPGGKPFGKPAGGKPAGGKPAGGKSFAKPGAKPGSKSFAKPGGKPTTRDSGDKPRGGAGTRNADRRR